MEAKAIGRYLRVTPRKARFVLDTVRGKPVDEAIAILKFVPNEAARYIEIVLKSAVANAEHYADMHTEASLDRSALKIESAFVDQGPTIKRIHPRAMGRAFRILKRMSHITVVVKEDEKLKAVHAQTRGRKAPAAGRAKAASKAAAPKPAVKKAAPKPAAKAKGAGKTPEKTED
jgi:large subunit ribosomal protein L22